MATQQKIKFTEAERKSINNVYEKIKGKFYEPKDYIHDRITEPQRRLRRGSIIPMADKINHCKTTGGTMSECTACNLKRGEKVESQKKCHFYKKATFKERCTFETFGEYCWCIDAQTDAKKG